ncbi:MAG: heme ABC transporter permease CcmC [Alphaproteobacteria bacterium]
MINYFFKLQNFDKFFDIFTKILPPIIIFLILIAGYKIYYSPDDYQQSNAVKIMYIHVPSAWMSLLVYSLMAIFNVSGFVWKNRFYYLIARSIAEIGAVFTLITLVTGAIWGKPIWGTLWAFDARLTSVLLLFFLYLAYIILYDNIADKIKAEKISAIIAIVGFVNIPLIKFSVEYWNSLHQKASIFRSAGVAIHPAFLAPLLLTFAIYLLIFILFSLIKIKTILNIYKINSLTLNKFL